MTIRNKGATPDRLTGGSADFATVEVHQMTSENGVSKMRELKDGLNIPAHGSVGLSPGGYHLMFTHLTHPLTKGDSVKAMLNFEHAGPVEVEFNVMGIGLRGPAGLGADEGHEDVKRRVRSRTGAAIGADRERLSRSRGPTPPSAR